MKKAVLIIGNGFDLFHSLPTRYNDFLSIIKGMYENIYQKEIRVYKYLNSIENTKNLIAKKYPISSQFFINKKHFIDRTYKNIWFQYFLYLNDEIKTNINTWIDFELEIKNVLELINSIIQFVNYGQILFSPAVSETYSYFYLPLTNPLEAEKLKIFNFVKKIDSEKNRIHLNKDYINSFKNSFIEFEVEKYLEFLYNQLGEFEDIFIEYLNIFTEPFISGNLIEPDSQIFSQYDFTQIYSFNYTNTTKLYTRLEPVFLHGSIAENSIVFGINDLKEKLDNRMIMFTKYYRRLLYKNFSRKVMNFENIECEVICIFGHSLNKSDEVYIRNIFDYVSNANNIQIVIYYHSEYAKSQLINNLLQIFSNIEIENLLIKNKLVFEILEG